MMLPRSSAFRIGSGAVVATALASVVAALAATQTRDADKGSSRADGSIAGTVLSSSEANRPIAGSVVVLRDLERGVSRQTDTNLSGRFVFGSLPEGHYLITASKSPYVSA